MKRIRLTESDIRNIVRRSVNRVLNENTWGWGQQQQPQQPQGQGQQQPQTQGGETLRPQGWGQPTQQDQYVLQVFSQDVQYLVKLAQSFLRGNAKELTRLQFACSALSGKIKNTQNWINGGTPGGKTSWDEM